jgi:putative methanogenesis marker protein 8
MPEKRSYEVVHAMDIKVIFDQLEKDKDVYDDLHLLRFYSSFVTVSAGKVIRVTKPYMRYCPLAGSLYGKMMRPQKTYVQVSENTIKEILENKIARFGLFSGNRELFSNSIAVPYGASEILMYAMRKEIIDAAVIVCDGSGTVIVNDPDVVQGIGARMNGLFYTSPIGGVQTRLRGAGCVVPFSDAAIDQVKGVEKAAELGYKKIAVTINALMDERLEKIGEIEKKYDAEVTVLTICTTGATEENIRKIEEYSDIVWSCASKEAREITGKRAILQLSKKIPVFVLTAKGLVLAGGYSSESSYIRNLDPRKQYIADSAKKGKEIGMGDFKAYLREEHLPLRSKGEPRLFDAGKVVEV